MQAVVFATVRKQVWYDSEDYPAAEDPDKDTEGTNSASRLKPCLCYKASTLLSYKRHRPAFTIQQVSSLHCVCVCVCVFYFSWARVKVHAFFNTISAVPETTSLFLMASPQVSCLVVGCCAFFKSMSCAYRCMLCST